MSRITVAGVCSLMGLSDPARNMQTLDRWCRRAQQAGADLVLFPEMFNIYDCPMSEDRSQGGFTFAIDPYGEVVHCDQGAGDEEKMALITVDSDVVRARRDMEGPGFNLFTRRPEVYGRLVSGPAGPRRAVEPDF